MEVQKIKENYQKALNRMKEDGTARKRAEKKEAQVQNIGTGKKHGKQCSDFRNVGIKRKKNLQSLKKTSTANIRTEYGRL